MANTEKAQPLRKGTFHAQTWVAYPSTMLDEVLATMKAKDWKGATWIRVYVDGTFVETHSIVGTTDAKNVARRNGSEYMPNEGELTILYPPPHGQMPIRRHRRPGVEAPQTVLQTVQAKWALTLSVTGHTWNMVGVKGDKTHTGSGTVETTESGHAVTLLAVRDALLKAQPEFVSTVTVKVNEGALKLLSGGYKARKLAGHLAAVQEVASKFTVTYEAL